MRLFCVGLILASVNLLAAERVPLSPTAVVASADGSVLYVACATANRVLRFDTTSQKVSGSITVPDAPSGLVSSPDEKQLFITCASPESKVCVMDIARCKIIATIPAGHTATAPVVSPDGKILYVCNRFDNDVRSINLATKKETCRVAVQREPVAGTITPDGKYLFVANLLHTGRADVNYVAAVVSVIDAAAKKVVKELPLPNGSGSLNDIRISPDGRYAVVTHIVGRFSRLTTHATEGWINANALTVIDVANMRVYGTTLLDDPFQGAANPWGVAWSADSKTLVVTHAGTHEISVIDFPDLLKKLPPLSADFDPVKQANEYAASRASYDLPDDLPYFPGKRRRIKLPPGDLGPRSAVIIGRKVYVANYFSDTLSVVDLDNLDAKPESVPLAPKTEMSEARKGEFYFNDASMCYEGWQSCASCHPGGGRVDGLNWDLLNDGIGNPKNVKSLLLAHKTPPAMWTGVRANAETAVRAGIEHILFTQQPDSVATAIDEYLKSLKPVPSPHLVKGKLSKAAKRGEKLFNGMAGCSECHEPGLFTDLKPHNAGTRRSFDGPDDRFYTPSLIEAWRTAPYLHDGSAATIRDVLTSRNSERQHGEVQGLSKQELDDLCEYVLSL